MKNLIPRFIRYQFKRNQFGGRFKAASLFVDISGFTAMTEALMAHGKVGAEVLAETLISVFDPLVTAVYAHGGIVTGFAGDAFTALFPLQSVFEGDQVADAHDDLAGYKNAVAAARTVQQNILHNPLRATRYGEFTFAVKVGVGDGEVEWGILRAEPLVDKRAAPRAPKSEKSPARPAAKDIQHAYYFRGQAIQSCTGAEHDAEKGDLIIAKSVYERFKDVVHAESASDEYVRVLDIPVELAKPVPNAAWQAEADIQTAFFPPEIVLANALGEFRRVVTVFIKVKDVQTVEELNLIMQPVFRLVKQYKGCLARFAFGDKGCNVLLFWGAPLSYENDAERALNFLLDLKQHTDIPFRAGVTYRLMYAGYAGGSLQGEYTCYGRGINLAARHMVKADWGEVWLGEHAVKAVQTRFELEFKGNYEFKGFAEPLPVSILKGRKQTNRPELQDRQMIGRETELRHLLDFVKPAVDPDLPTAEQPEAEFRRFAGICYIYGEAGMGKSLLLSHFEKTVGEQHYVEWIHCPCDEILQQSLNPIKHFLKAFFRQHPADTEAESKTCFEKAFQAFIDRLEHAIRDMDLSIYRSKDVHYNMDDISRQFIHKANLNRLLKDIIIELKRTQSVLAGIIDLRYPGSLFEELEPRLRFENMLFAFKNFVLGMSVLHPVIFVIEDSQWIDSDSKGFIKTFLRAIEPYPIAIICLSRYDDKSGKPRITPDAAGTAQMDIELNVLTPDGVRAVAEHVVDGKLGEKAMSFTVEKTQGNPFFVEQLVMTLKEQNYLTAVDGVYDLTISQLDNVPDSITGVLISRLDKLPLDVKNAVQVASVLGMEFALSVLKRLIDQKKNLTAAIRRALADAIWFAQSKEQYLFRHALMRDAAYEMQLRSRLRDLHRQAGEAIENLFASQLAPYYADLAYHFEKAEAQDKTIEYLRKAADYARENYQNHASLDFYLRLNRCLDDALKMIDGNVSTVEVNLHSTLLLENYAESLLYTNHILTILGQKDEKIILKALEFAEHTHHADISAWAHLDYGNFLISCGEFEKAQTHLEKSRCIFEQTSNKRFIVRVFSAMGQLLWTIGHIEKALNTFEAMRQYCEEIKHNKGIADALSNIGLIYDFKGEFKDALHFYQRSLELCQLYHDKNQFARTIGNMGVAYYYHTDYTKAMDCYQQKLKLVNEVGDKREIALTVGNIALIYHKCSEYEIAMNFHQKKLELCRELDDKVELANVLGEMGNTFKAQGAFEQAMIHYDQALQISQQLGIKFIVAPYLIEKAELLFLIKEFQKAGEMNHSGLTIAEEIGSAEYIAKGKELTEKINFMCSSYAIGIA